MNEQQLAEFKAQLARAARGTFWEHIGAELASFADDRVVLTLQVKPHHMNLIGILHGGVSATLLDSAMGVLAAAARPDDTVVTTNLNMHFLSQVKDGEVKVEAELVHSSRKLITMQGRIYKDNGELSAFGTATFHVIDRRPPKAE
ncbi:PaaI family thioesterase [Cohnella thermotolerans]|uniref:PaaI family thioesterase n=1 Tax=Cohnella thermotolerans TaxID=329858 RepID=UPI00041F5BA3|nr:PaaI family thioesterase [Cohnella thermotolerans]